MKTISAPVESGLVSNSGETWKRVTVDGVDRTSLCTEYSYEYPAGEHGATAKLSFANEDGELTGVFAVGQILQIEEGWVRPGGVVENFGGFYGEIISANPTQDGGVNRMAVNCADYAGILKDMDLDAQVESPKTAIQAEGLTPTPLPAPNAVMAQVFSFANSAIATTPPPVIYIRDMRTDIKFVQESGWQVDYENGTLLLGNPINTTDFKVLADYSYYPTATAYDVENVIEEIITALDGYGNTKFTVAEHLTETFENVDGLTVDTMKPNYSTSVVDGVSYPAGQLWFTTYNRITDSLVAGDFTVPGASIDDISEKFGRIILDAPISTDAVVTLNQSYSFRTVQATGVRLNYLSMRSKNIKNRRTALKAAMAILNPNYILCTRQTSPGKIWARYQTQQVVNDSKLYLATDEKMEGDTDVYTRVILYGRNINPDDLALGTDVRFVIPETETVMNTVRWEAVDWLTQGAASATPAMSNGRIEIQPGDAMQSQNTLSRGTFETRIRAGSNFAWRVGFVKSDNLGTEPPQGVYFESSGLFSGGGGGLAARQRGNVYCVCRDGVGETAVNAADGARARFFPVSEVDTKLRIEWDSTSAIFYIDDVNIAEISTNLPDASSKVVFWAAVGVLSIEYVRSYGGNGSEVIDYFLTQNYIGTAYRHLLSFVDAIDGFRTYGSGVIAGQILPYPPPLIYVNGLPLVSGIHEVTDAPVSVVERAYTYDRGSGRVGANVRIDTDYAYEIHFSHRSISPSEAIEIYDSTGSVLFTIAANTPAEIEIGRTSWSLTFFGTVVSMGLLAASVLKRMDYARGIYYVHPRDVGLRRSSWDFSRHIHRNDQYFFERQQQFTPSTASYSVHYSDDLREIDYENGLITVRDEVFANLLDPDVHPRDIVEMTFNYMEAYQTMENAFSMIDGNMQTNAQMAFKDAPVPGHHLFTLDLGSDEEIDAIDIVGGYYIPEQGQNRRLRVDMTLSLYTSDDGITFSLPCKEALKFDLSSGDVMSFEHEQLGDGFSARFLQVRLESTENITFGSPKGIWPISIQQFRVYQKTILRGEATLVAAGTPETDSTVEDVDGILAEVGDRVFKERRSDQFLGTEEHLNRVAKGFLQEFYKNHTRLPATVEFGPQYEQSSTVEVTNPTNKITQRNHFVESVVCNNGRRTLRLARYP